MKMTTMHSASAVESQGESPVKSRTLDPEQQQLARKLLELALDLGVEVWGGVGWEGSGGGLGRERSGVGWGGRVRG